MHVSIFRFFKRLYNWIKVSNGLPFVVLVSYTLVGATLFRNLELNHDVEARARYRNSTEYAFIEALDRLMKIPCHRESRTDSNNTRVTRAAIDSEHAVKETLFWFIDYLNLTQVIDERSAPTPWTWIGSAFYAGQLYTTIGYGFPVVQTNMGKVVSIVYIMLGIPIFLIILKEVGRLLSRALRKIYKRWRTAKNRLPDSAKRRMSEPVKAIYSLTGVGSSASPSKSMKSLKSTTCSDAPLTTESPPRSPDAMEKGLPSEDGKDKNASGAFPIPLALAILIMWILISAGLFCFWESGWGYLTSVYFYFVSISTVGLGDIVPSKPDMMLVNFVLILVGLALLSMCISLVQEALERALSQLLQEYINDLEKMAAIVTTADNEFIEESATPFEVATSADLLTAPLTALSTGRHEGYVVGFQQRAKDWFAERLVENVLVPRLETSDPDSDSEDCDTPSNGSTNECADSIGEASIANNRKSPARRILSRRPNFALNCNMQTLRAVQAMEKVKIKTKIDGTFRGKLFAKFVTNKQFNKFFDDHIIDPVTGAPGQTASVAGTVKGNADNGVNFRAPEQVGRCKLVTPEKDPSTKAGSVVTVSSQYDADSIYSNAYFDITYGYSTDSVPKLIALDAKQKADEARIEKYRERRNSRPPGLPLLPTPRPSLIPPPLAEADVTDVASIKINVKESSDSPEPFEHVVTMEPWRRRCSTPMAFLSPGSHPDHNHCSRTQMPMSRCPSCQHVATTPLTHAVEAEAMRRVRDICGLLPGDFTPGQHYDAKGRRRTLSPSPSHQDDSGYENSAAIDSHLSDAWTNSTSLLTPNGVEKKIGNGCNGRIR
uniref:Ion_trans_2 domain-containing protein n=1 Tax=Panagrellus redivivus TaxID=6233 RepID=A0A7E4W7P4_PANRE